MQCLNQCSGLQCQVLQWQVYGPDSGSISAAVNELLPNTLCWSNCLQLNLKQSQSDKIICHPDESQLFTDNKQIWGENFKRGENYLNGEKIIQMGRNLLKWGWAIWATIKNPDISASLSSLILCHLWHKMDEMAPFDIQFSNFPRAACPQTPITGDACNVCGRCAAKVWWAAPAWNFFWIHHWYSSKLMQGIWQTGNKVKSVNGFWDGYSILVTHMADMLCTSFTYKLEQIYQPFGIECCFTNNGRGLELDSLIKPLDSEQLGTGQRGRPSLNPVVWSSHHLKHVLKWGRICTDHL